MVMLCIVRMDLSTGINMQPVIMIAQILVVLQHVQVVVLVLLLLGKDIL
jgi:hypothetical protein